MAQIGAPQIYDHDQEHDPPISLAMNTGSTFGLGSLIHRKRAATAFDAGEIFAIMTIETLNAKQVAFEIRYAVGQAGATISTTRTPGAPKRRCALSMR